MVLNRILKTIVEQGYSTMNSNLVNMALFYKNTEQVMNIAAVVVNDKGMYGAEQLREISFQVERKFLLKGNRKVNIQYIVMTDDVDRDKHICDGENMNVWLVDTVVNRVISYEDFDNEFNELYTKLDDEIALEEKEDRVDWKKLPFVTIGLFLINILVFVIVELNGSSYDTDYMLKCGAADWKLIFNNHQYYRLITCMFLHFGISHITNNMFSLLIVGKDVEKMYGRINMLIIYFVSGIGASIVSAVYNMITGKEVVAAGASGAIFGIVGAVVVGSLFYSGDSARNVRRVFILILIMALCGSGHIDNAAHAGGFLVGVMVSFIIMKTVNQNKSRLEDYCER